MTLPESGGTPLVPCPRVRQTHVQRFSAGWAPGGGCAEWRKTNASLRPLGDGFKDTCGLIARDCTSLPRRRAAAETRRTMQELYTRHRRPGRRAERRDSDPHAAAPCADIVRESSAGLPSRSSRRTAACRTGAKAGVPEGTQRRVDDAGQGFGALRGVKTQAYTTRATARVALRLLGCQRREGNRYREPGTTVSGCSSRRYD
jgi:hypothetical protein